MPIAIRWIAPAALVTLASSPAFAAQYLSIEQARALIFPQAEQFIAAPLNLKPPQSRRVREMTGLPLPSPAFKLWRAESGGRLIGWFFVHQVIGKHEYLTFATGITPEGALKQFEIIEYREMYGFQVREPKWRAQFVGKTVADSVTLGIDIANISNATLSCRHVTEGIKQLLAVHDTALR